MTLLIISPDYLSHLLPLATLATAWRDRGEQVVVATGPATRGQVAGFGYHHVELRLGRGSNPGVIRPEEQPRGEDDALRGFFAATRRGMLETLLFQADARRDDLLWEPVATARRVLEVVADVRPDRILVDHLAFSARLALDAAAIAYADVVLGHPSALPVAGEIYGVPPAWPAAMRPDAAALDELRRRCGSVRDAFTDEWNAALEILDPAAAQVPDAFRTHGPVLLLNYPRELHDPARTAQLPPHTFLGSAVRSEPAPAWLTSADPRPVVTVSFGSFLSAREDVLATVVAALRPLPVRVALATGSASRAALGSLPAHWLVSDFIPQAAILRRAALAVTHTGNNSVTEALTSGVPMLMLPFSTDQFAGAAAAEAAGLGTAIDPNTATAETVRAAVLRLLADGATNVRAATLADRLRADPGPLRAYTALTAAGAGGVAVSPGR